MGMGWQVVRQGCCVLRLWEAVLMEGERLTVGEFGEELRAHVVGSFM